MIPVKAPGFWRPSAASSFPDTYFLISGFVGSSSVDQADWYDRDNTLGPWYSNYQALSPSQYAYFYSTTSNSTPGWDEETWTTISDFDLGGTYFVVCSSSSNTNDIAQFDAIFVNGSDATVAAMWFESTGLQTRMHLSSILGSPDQQSTNFFTNGNLTFTSSSVVFTNTGGTNATGNLTLSSVSMNTVVAVKVRPNGLVCNPVGTTAWAGFQMQKTV